MAKSVMISVKFNILTVFIHRVSLYQTLRLLNLIWNWQLSVIPAKAGTQLDQHNTNKHYSRNQNHAVK